MAFSGYNKHACQYGSVSGPYCDQYEDNLFGDKCLDRAPDVCAYDKAGKDAIKELQCKECVDQENLKCIHDGELWCDAEDARCNQVISNEIEVKDEESSIESNVEKLLELSTNLTATDNNTDRFMQPQIESCAISLWNLAVGKKTCGKITVRYAAYRLMTFGSSQNSDEISYQKKIKMSLKTAVAFLEIGNYSMADSLLTTTHETIIAMKALISKNNSKDDERKIIDADKDLLKLLSHWAEAANGLENIDKAMQCIKDAKSLLQTFPEEGAYLSMLCYNFGVECFQKHQYSDSACWLQESYQLGKGSHGIGSKNLARTLRLLANVYLDWDSSQYHSKALNAIGLANAEYPHSRGFYLKIKTLLQGEVEDDTLFAEQDCMLRNSNLDIESGLHIIRLIYGHKRVPVALEGITKLSRLFQNSTDIGKIKVAHLEMLLENGQQQEAKSLIEDCIISHSTGKPFDMNTKKRFHFLLWEKGAEAFDGKDYKGALQWYNYSLSLYAKDHGKDPNRAKLQRNRANCFLALKLFDDAEEAVKEADTFEPDSPYTQLISFKIALHQGQDEKAINMIQKMTQCSPVDPDVKHCDKVIADIHGLICLAAQQAFEQSNHSVTINALENLIDYSTNPQQVFTALRCLIRLKLTVLSDKDYDSQETSIMLGYLKKAYESLKTSSTNGNFEASFCSESLWFMKIAWNLALQRRDSSKGLHDLFQLCCQFTSLCPEDLSALIRQKTCLLMCTASCLQSAKECHDEMDKRTLLQQAIQHVEQCWGVNKKIQELKSMENDKGNKDVTTPTLLLLYEFEARAKLHDPNLEAVLEKALSLPYSEPKTFETLAALAIEANIENKNICTRALKVAIKKHLHCEPVDYKKCSKSFHSLIKIAFPTVSSSNSTNQEEAWGYYMDVINLIEKAPKDSYPEMEILWLMTRAWNCGIHFFSSEKYEDAGHWCELGMKFLKHLGGLKSGYEEQMTTVYGDILAKITKRKEQ